MTEREPSKGRVSKYSRHLISSNVVSPDIQSIPALASGKAVMRSDAPAMWTEALASSSSQEVRCTNGWLNYQESYYSERDLSFCDWSMILMKSGQPIALWPISFRVEQGGEPVLDSFGEPLREPTPLVGSEIGNLHLAQFAQSIRPLLEQAGAQTCPVSLSVTGLGALTGFGRALTLGAAAEDCLMEMFTSIGNSAEERNSRIRASYRRKIRRAQEVCQVEVHGREDVTTIDALKSLHRRVAGRITRSEATWQRQLEAVEGGEAFVALAYHQQELVGGALIHHSADEALYAVGAYDRDLMASGLSIGHLVQWSVLNHLSETLRINRYSLGYRMFRGPSSDKKLLGIDNFKQGFSTEVIPRPVVRVASPNIQHRWEIASE